MTQKSYSIEDRVKDVRFRCEEAALKAGRSPADITLLGVTKTHSAEDVRRVIEAGVTVIGENRVQELLQKEPFLTDLPHEAHLIGHLQKNKAKYLPGHISMLQSLDSEATATALEKAYGETGEVLDVLIEVNIGEESSKSGVLPADVHALAQRVFQSETLRLRGLMAIPPFGSPDGIRPYFRRMNQIFIDIKEKKVDNIYVNMLSMGMSADFEVAIAEGATIVRVGTELFGPRG